MKSTEASDILTERPDYSIFRLDFTSATYEKSRQKSQKFQNTMEKYQ